MSLIVRTCRTLTDRSFSLLKVEQRRPEPRDTIPYVRFFRCPVEFGAPVDALTFDKQVLDQPLPAANPELAQHNDGLIQRYLSKIGQDTLVARVRGALVEQLGSDPSPVALSAALGMSARTLQRRLQEQGTSVVELLSEVRQELACAYLRDKTYSITEIAFLLGFEDSSAFARAFRRWTGRSPSEYRAEPR
jgi:AraC-like DNA-binding protein